MSTRTYADSVVAYAQAGWPCILPVPVQDKFPPIPLAEPVALYRHVDALGELLYVGITNDLGRRWEEHRATSQWSRFATATYVQWFPDRASASRAETSAIGIEGPLFNDRRPRRGGWVHDRALGPFAIRRGRYLRTGTSGALRRVPCKIIAGEFCCTCGPDAEAYLESVTP